MANFFNVVIVFSDGHHEEYSGQMYYLGGQEHEDMKLYRELKHRVGVGKLDGSIVDAYWSYES